MGTKWKQEPESVSKMGSNISDHFVQIYDVITIPCMDVF